MSAGPDFAHTGRATRDRSSKAVRLAAHAARSGVVPYELDEASGPAHVAVRGAVRKGAGVRSASAETWAEVAEQLWWLLDEAARGQHCESCGAPIRWVTTEGGKTMPLNPLPHPEGNVYPVQLDVGVRARVIGGGQARPDGVAMFRSHFVTCPDGPQHRRRRERSATACRACGHPLDESLRRVEPQFDTHPSCDLKDEPR